MLGAVIIVVAMVFALPIGLFIGGAIWSALIGTVMVIDRREAAETKPGGG